MFIHEYYDRLRRRDLCQHGTHFSEYTLLDDLLFLDLMLMSLKKNKTFYSPGRDHPMLR